MRGWGVGAGTWGTSPASAVHAAAARLTPPPSLSLSQFKIIDFGVATFDPLLAEAAGGYECEVRGGFGGGGVAEWEPRRPMLVCASTPHRLQAPSRLPTPTPPHPPTHPLHQEALGRVQQVFASKRVTYDANGQVGEWSVRAASHPEALLLPCQRACASTRISSLLLAGTHQQRWVDAHPSHQQRWVDAHPS